MKALRVFLIVFLLLVIVGTIFYLTIRMLNPKPAGISVVTNPPASVYINGTFVGKTPFTSTREPGEIKLKLVPDGADKVLLSFETKINLVSGIQTVVRREFGDTEENSSGDVLSFDKVPTGETSLVVVTTPDNSQVSIDGVVRGFAPYKTATISPAKHQITIKASGYTDRVMTVALQKGYRLTVFAKLALDISQKDRISDPDSTPVPSAKKYVQILNTSTGFLRVRTEPGKAGEEIAEIKPGSRYPFLGTDNTTGWYKIQYEEPKPGLPNGITGWISNQYAKIIDESGREATESSDLNP